MSDSSLPPAPPPSPPPSSFTPPPGYAEYQPTNWQASMRRVRGLSMAILIVLAVAAIGSLVMAATIGSAKDAAEEYLAIANPTDADEDQFNEDVAGYGLGGLLVFATLIALAVLSIIWLYRITSNLRALGRATFWAPLWAIFGWFLPPFLFVIPLLILIEAWKASDPQSPPGSDSWRRSPQPVPVWAWFLVYGVARTAATFLTGSPFDQFSRDAEDVAERFVDHSGGLVVQSLIEIIGAGAWALVVWQLTRRHTELTGESSGR
jgi:Domain of unknown function (DUF4328)